MGVLDDAIREHLELKRKQGADEDEIERQQEEALGPARREAESAEEDGAEGPAQAEPQDDGAEEAHPAGPQLETEEDGAEAAPEAEAQLETEPDDGDPLGFPVLAPEEQDDEASEPPPPGSSPEEERAPDEDELVKAEPDEDPDVLVDTPDFLQETPEHDRLWFEQKPPRDFDFD